MKMGKNTENCGKGEECGKENNRLYGKEIVLLASGSFNPPHVGHLRMLEKAREHLEKEYDAKVAGIIMSPVADQYGCRKPTLVPARHRLRMCELAVENGKNGGKLASVSRWEAEGGKWTPVGEVLRHHQRELEKIQSDAKLLLLCGGDLIDAMLSPHWRGDGLMNIVNKFGIVCDGRGVNIPQMLAKIYHKFHAIPNGRLIIYQDETFPHNLSSTLIRKAIEHGETIRHCTPDPVIEYIYKEGLYENEKMKRRADDGEGGGD